MTDQTERTSSRITVAFSGPGAGTAPLTWGQKAIAREMRETGWTHNSVGAHPLPAGTTLAAVAENLRTLMNRHPALRMRLGTDPQGRPCQLVSESGETDLEIVTIADASEPAGAGTFVDDLCHEWMGTPIDPYRQWSLRMAVIRHRGVLLHRVFAVGHLAADGAAILRILADLRLGRPVGRRADARTVGPLELGRLEQTQPTRRISDRAMRYWEGQLRSLPPLTFGAPDQPHRQCGNRFRTGRFDSPSAHLAVLAIAERTRTDTARVLLAVIATAIGRAAGVNPLTAKVVASNRFRPGFGGAVATLRQDSVLTVELAGTVDDVVTRIRQASTIAALHAYYDPDQLDELMTRLDRERGYPARITCRINDRRAVRPPAGAIRGAAVTPDRIRAKAAETVLVWDGDLDFAPEQVFIAVEDRPRTVHLRVIFDSAYLTERQAESLLRGVEEVAVAAAFDPAAPTRVQRCGPIPVRQTVRRSGS